MYYVKLEFTSQVSTYDTEAFQSWRIRRYQQQHPTHNDPNLLHIDWNGRRQIDDNQQSAIHATLRLHHTRFSPKSSQTATKTKVTGGRFWIWRPTIPYDHKNPPLPNSNLRIQQLIIPQRCCLLLSYSQQYPNATRDSVSSAAAALPAVKVEPDAQPSLLLQ